MDIYFDRIHVCIGSSDEQLVGGLRRFLGDWEERQARGSLPYQTACESRPVGFKTIQFDLELVDRIPPNGSRGRLFDGRRDIGEPWESHFEVTLQDHYYLLRFNDEAVVQVPVELGLESVQLRGQITPGYIESGFLEDVYYTSLAPVLRRWGYMMLHAFGVVSPEGRAVLIVGPSNSGKTTSGLSLVLADWGYLSNDVSLIREENGRIVACPTPGAIGITQETRNLLPRLAQRVEWPKEVATTGKQSLPIASISNGWSENAPVDAICFPKIMEDGASFLEPTGRALALARLAEHSVDRWDRVSLEDSVGLLESLCVQAKIYDLHLGADLAQLDESLAAIWV